MILVVGAGPTGLMLALELARHGVPFRVVDKSPVASTHSKALAIHARSLEALHTLGLAERFLAVGQKAGGAAVYVRGKKVGEGRFDGLKEEGTRFPFILIVSQAETERILAEALAERGHRVERGVALETLRQDPQGVHTNLGSFSYVAGCDGAHSRVRHLLGVPFVGAAYAQRFLLADATADWDVPADDFSIFLGAQGLCAYFPFKEAGCGRFIIADHKPEDESEPTIARIEEAVRLYSQREVKLTSPRWVARFRLHHRCVTHYSAGRVFLLGDAAHIHSPAGGQGMNTGLQDAFNLGWKLAAVVRDGVPAKLLESYDAERRPIGEYLMKRTDRLFTLMASTHPAANALRNFLVPFIAPRVLGTPAWRLRAFRFVSQLGIRYSHSPIVQPGAGQRMPDQDVGDGRTVLDLLRDGKHHVVGDVLVRPDGHIACRGSAATIQEFLTSFKSQRMSF